MASDHESEKTDSDPGDGPDDCARYLGLLDEEDEEGTGFAEPVSLEVAEGMLKEDLVGGGEGEESLVDIAAAGETSVNMNISHTLFVL